MECSKSTVMMNNAFIQEQNGPLHTESHNESHSDAGPPQEILICPI